MRNTEVLKKESLPDIQEIDFPAKTILSLLQAHQKAGDMPEIKSLFRSGSLLKGRQKFLLTEKNRVAPLGCEINLGVYGKSKDGIDGIWGQRTAISTANYLQRLFDPSHPGRRTWVKTKLQARAGSEKETSKKKSLKTTQSLLEKARLQDQFHTELLKKSQLQQLRKLQKDILSSPTEKQPPALDEQITVLEKKITSLTTEAKNLETTLNDEENRIGKLFFAITLDDKVVVLQEEAEKTEKNVFQQLEGNSDLTKVQIILQSTKAQTRDRLITSDSYSQFIDEQMQSGKTENEAQQMAEIRLDQATQVLAMRTFGQQVQQGNVVRSIGEEQLILEAGTISLLQTNQQLQAFEYIYEKIIIEQYEIIMNGNQLDRKIPLGQNRLLTELTSTALYENSEIEKYLFDIPDKSSGPIHTLTQGSLKDPALYEHIRAHFLSTQKSSSAAGEVPQGKPPSQDTSPEKSTQIQEFETELNTYTSKRIRQILLRQSLTTILGTFSFHDVEGVPLSEKVQYDLSKMQLDNQFHSLKYPITYGSYDTLLTLHGQTGHISIDSLFDKMIGINTPLELTNVTSQQSIFELLVEAVQLTSDEVLMCHSKEDLQQYITQKMSQKVQEMSYIDQNNNQIAQRMEHQALLSYRRGYVDGKHTPKSSMDPTLEFPTKETKATSSMLAFLKLCTQGGEKPALSLAQTQQLNHILSDKQFQKGFEKITTVPYGFEQFLLDIDFFSFAQKNRPTNILQFFEALHAMCISQVPPDEEKGYKDLKKMLPELPIGTSPPTTQEGPSDPKYVYEKNQIIPYNRDI